MKKQILNFTLYALMVYLTGSTLNPPVAASQPSGGNGTHFCGGCVIDYSPNKQYADQFPNRNYVRTSAANLNVGDPNTVRLIYFLPNNRQPHPDIDTKADTAIKGVQQFYADMMESHGFGGKTFRFETDTTGKAVVHHVNGKFDDAYYLHSPWKVVEEIDQQFDRSRNFYLTALDVSSELRDNRIGPRWLGITLDGVAIVFAPGFGVAGHELGHLFGLQHDFRKSHGDQMVESFCTAEWLDAHPAFNPDVSPLNHNYNTTTEMLSLNLLSPPNTFRLRFKVTDADGLHQAQLHAPEIKRTGGLLACKRLTGTSRTVEFVITTLLPKYKSVSLVVMDVHGNFSWSEEFPIDITSLLPPPEVVSIPDANLAAAMQHKIDSPITTHTILNLSRLDIVNSQITNLTGLEHALNLKTLLLWNNSVSDISALARVPQLMSLALPNNSVSDISALAGLTKLTWLNLDNNSVSDISALGGLTQLTELNLRDNSVSDISALGGLTQLTELSLRGNSVSDISVLAGLTQLTTLDLLDNSVSDISALGGLTQLTTLDLLDNSVSDISALAGLIQLTGLSLSGDSVSDISVLAGLTQLTGLSLRGNSVSDISVLAGLTQLTWLGLSGNSVSDISALAGLTKLTGLNLFYNSVSDISALAGLTKLTHLNLSGNLVSDISALAGLTKLTSLYLKGNPLSYISINTHIPAMQAKGIGVQFDPRPPTTLVKISGDQHGAPATPLSRPFVVEVRDEWGRLCEGVPVTFAVTGGDVTLSATHTTTNADGKAESILTLGPNLGTYTVSVSAAGVEQPVTFTAVARKGVIIPSNNLRAAVRRALSVAADVPIGPSEIARLTTLKVSNATIDNLTGLELATNLTYLDLGFNSVSDISALAGLTKLTGLYLGSNSVSDISALAGLTKLTYLNLYNNSISDISALAGLTKLIWLNLSYNSVSDISALGGLTQLTDLSLSYNSVSDISALGGLTQLTDLGLSGNSVSDISPLVANAGLWSGDTIYLETNPLSHASIHTHIPTLQRRGVTVKFDNQAYPALLKISGDNQKDMPGEILANPFVVEAQDENGSVLAGIPIIFTITVGGGKLGVIHSRTDSNGRAESTLTLGPNLGTNTVKVSAAGISSTVIFHAISAIEYLWAIPAGASWIHVPLKVTTVNGTARSIKSVSDLYDALGGVDIVNLLTTHDPAAQRWHSYLGDLSRGMIADKELTDDTGIIAVMNDTVSLRLSGDPLGTNGRSSIALHPGPNLVGVPLIDSRIDRVSDLLTLEGIEGNVSAVMVSDNRRFKRVERAGDAGDIPITGGQAFVLIAREGATVAISGEGWSHSSTLAGPSIGVKGVEVTDTTPVLALRGSIVAPKDGWGKMPWAGQGISSGGERGKMPRLRVIVKNLSTGKAVSTERRSREVPILGRTASAFRTVLGDEKAGYQVTFVDIETGRAAQIGDILEISVRSPSPLIGVQPLQYTVTAEDVLRSRIELPALIAYEIPSKTELLANYPNPFNPETWIPYRLAEDAVVTLTIYDREGQVVRTLNVGHRIAAAYESQPKAIHWDGRNDLGEGVASGIYFYTLSAGDYSATRKMVILK